MVPRSTIGLYFGLLVEMWAAQPQKQLQLQLRLEKRKCSCSPHGRCRILMHSKVFCGAATEWDFALWHSTKC